MAGEGCLRALDIVHLVVRGEVFEGTVTVADVCGLQIPAGGPVPQAALSIRDVTPTRGRQGITELLHRQRGRQGDELQALLQWLARQAPQHQAGGEHVPGTRRVGD